MTKFEFEQRVKVQVSENEYRNIEKMYMCSDVDKDEFCTLWAKMNCKRVNQSRERAKKIEKEAKVRQSIFEIFEEIRYLGWEDSIKYAEDYFSTKQKKILSSVGIELGTKRIEPIHGHEVIDPKLVSTIAYECSVYLNIA